MSAAVGAALKKIAAGLLADKRTWEKLACVLLAVLFLFLFPLIAVQAVFKGAEFDADDPAFQQAVIGNLSVETIGKLQNVEAMMLGIESAMKGAGLEAEVKKAQVLYTLALYQHSLTDPLFVSKLVSCFTKDISDAQLVANINAMFGTSITVEDFSHVMQSVFNTDIDVKFLFPDRKNNIDLVRWVKMALKNGWGYVYGTYGNILDEATVQYCLEANPDYMVQWLDFIHANWMGRRCADCIGLIKAYGWVDPVTKEIEYGSHGFTDVGANSIMGFVTEQGSISSIPEIPGLAVQMDGHIGVYIGNGEVIEAAGAQYGVIKTRLSEGSWERWIRVPFIDYIDEMGNPI